MRAFALIALLAFAAIVLWRNVFTKKKERKLIRFGIKELSIAVAVSVFFAGGLFFVLTNNTWRVL